MIFLIISILLPRKAFTGYRDKKETELSYIVWYSNGSKNFIAFVWT